MPSLALRLFSSLHACVHPPPGLRVCSSSSRLSVLTPRSCHWYWSDDLCLLTVRTVVGPSCLFKSTAPGILDIISSFWATAGCFVRILTVPRPLSPGSPAEIRPQGEVVPAPRPPRLDSAAEVPTPVSASAPVPTPVTCCLPSKPCHSHRAGQGRADSVRGAVQIPRELVSLPRDGGAGGEEVGCGDAEVTPSCGSALPSPCSWAAFVERGGEEFGGAII